jgi:predicted aspartyl protease
MPALVDTGAGKTIITPAAVKRVGLQKIDSTRLARAGGVTENAGVYAASIQFQRDRLATIEMIEVICCELPEQPIQCLLGRDVLSRWVFTYDGPQSTWSIDEEEVGAWVEPPEEVDM